MSTNILKTDENLHRCTRSGSLSARGPIEATGKDYQWLIWGLGRCDGTVRIMNGHQKSSPRVGHGYDLHRLEPVSPVGVGRPMVLAGCRIDHDRGPVSHSDGDAVLHAVTDAILGALGQPDIGELFPNNDPKFESMSSDVFLTKAVDLMRKNGFEIGNVDITVICQRPKISKYKPAMMRQITTLLGCDGGQVNLKGKTHEEVDAVGEGRAIEVHAVILLLPQES